MLSSITWSKKNKHSFTDSDGLRILLTNLGNNGNSSKVVIKPNLTSHHHRTDQHRYGFLQSCHLCGKVLSLDEEVYMYKGEMGFCSLECRDRQIYMDEMKEIEISTQRVLESLQRRRESGGGRCEEFRPRRSPLSSENDRIIFL